MSALAADRAADAAAHKDVVSAANELAARAGSGANSDWKAKVDAVGPGGHTPLLLACAQGTVDAVAALLTLGADPAAEGDVSSISDQGSKYKCTPLILAARGGHVAIMKVLLAQKSMDANQSSSDTGTNALIVAGYAGGAEAVKVLLAHDGIEVNKATTRDGTTPLYAACQEGNAAAVKLLLAHNGIEVNKARTADGSTPLSAACHNGQAAVVKLLLAHGGIDVNRATTDDGSTPLFCACQNWHTEVVKLLLAHAGIDVNQRRTDTGSTPLYVACQNGHTEVVQLLLAHDEINMNQGRGDSGTTPLYMACYQGHAGVAKLLLAHDVVDVNQARTDTSSTPLYIACHQGYAEVVKVLLVHEKINVNQARPNGMVALHAAAAECHLGIAQLLVVHGADADALGIGGHTAAELAIVINQPLVADWLNAVAGWSQLRVAAGCRLCKEAAFLLRRGRIDPDDPAVTSIKDILALVATSKAKPAALPWQDAPRICKMTAKFVADAARGWHRTTHWLHHKQVRAVVFAVVMVVGRVEKKNLHDEPDPEATVALPVLPIDLWFHAMGFFKRSWWAVEA